MNQLKFQRFSATAKIPTKSRDRDAAYDIYSDHSVLVRGGVISKVHSNVNVQIPAGHVGLVCPRSGLAANSGITVVNAPGVIDENYRGELCVILTRLSDGDTYLKAGDRIAQLLIVKLPEVEAVEVGELDPDYERGTAGFGSSGA